MKTKSLFKIIFSLMIAQTILTGFVLPQSNSLLKLWYNKPAKIWNEALPVGNGRLGAMIFGVPEQEKIQLNEGTVWAGGPNRNDNPKAKNSLALIRKLIFDGKYQEAQDLAQSDFISNKNSGMPYQTVGNLVLTFPGHETYSDYYRELNLEDAVATTTYKANGTTFKRKIISSFPDQVIIIHLSADQKEKIKFIAAFESPHIKQNIKVENDELILSGITSDFEGVPGQIKFTAHVKIKTEGGKIINDGNTLIVGHANSATIYISIATNFVDYKNVNANEQKRASDYLKKAVKKDYQTAFKNNSAIYQKYFNRVKLDLGETESVKKATDQRIKDFSVSNDPQLVSLYFQFGRYLLISCSQPGGQPATLQGLWNNSLTPPWDSKYTININTEMNYWPSESTNLTETNEPLIQMIKELSVTGRQTAKDMYDADGWVAHHNTDSWRICGPVDGAYWGMWTMGGAWLSQHLWEKYLFNGDKKYLSSVYPALKGAAKFFSDFLTEEPEHKWLVVAPSISPENSPADHKKYSIAAGTTMDNQLVFDLFTKTIKAAEILKLDKSFADELKEKLHKLPPMQIGQYGQLQEWLKDWDDPSDKHRHVSHLYGLHPSNQISPIRNPELADAARTTLIQRGDESTGWSMGWKVNLWAKLLDGNHALKLIKDQLRLVEGEGRREGGGTYANMFDAHPPFQIDGNFGCTSGIAEMLMQSHDGFINILPATPDDWKTGSVSGLRTRGGFIIDIDWKNGEVTKLKIKSILGGNCRVGSFTKLISTNKAVLKAADGKNINPFFEVPEIKTPIISANAKLHPFNLKERFIFDFKTEAGKEYSFIKN